MVGHQDIDSYNLVLYLLHQAFIFVVPLINQRWFEKAFMRNTVKLCSLYPAILYLWFEQCLFLPNFLFFYFKFLFFKIVVDVKDIFLKKNIIWVSWQVESELDSSCAMFNRNNDLP
jgi:hypothetical protein